MPNPARSLADDALAVFRAGIDAVHPERLIAESVILDGEQLRIKDAPVTLSDYRRIIVLGTGKVTAYMARALENILGDRIADGAVTVRRGQSAPCGRIRVYEAGHPLPDEATIEGTRHVLKLADTVRPDDLVICLLSGGGSTLLEALPEDLSLSDLRETTRHLLGSGATIHEMNIVRRHLSLVKGGQLARRIAPARCIALVISDVPGDLLESVASGPLAPDPFTYAIALKVLQTYALEDRVPRSVIRYLEEGMEGEHPETVKRGDEVFRNVTHVIIGSNSTALDGAARHAVGLGYRTEIRSRKLHGEASEAGRRVARLVRELQMKSGPGAAPACLLFGGETTVTVRGKGSGGRNQELVLAAAAELRDVQQEFLVASCGTDGIDGNTEAAGGLVTPAIISTARRKGLDPGEFLLSNDSHTFLKYAEGLVVTGPTATNVMDLVLILVP